MKHNRVLVTGAGGFVGGRIAEVFHLNQFATVRAGARRWRSAARVARFQMDIALCDIMEPTQIASAMEDVTAVVHCASKDRRDVIVDGTRHLLEAALAAGVKRFVYLSTAEVYGKDACGVISEQHDRPQSGSVYADSKIEAEDLCWHYCQKGLPITILRPSIIFGPFGESWTIDMAKRLQSGNWGLFDDNGDGNCNLVHVDDVAGAAAAAILSESAPGEAFNIAGGYGLTWNDYFERYNAALQLAPLSRISTARQQRRSARRDRVSRVAGYFLNRFGDQLMDIYLRGGLASRVMRHVKQSLTTTPSGRELSNLFSRKAIYDATKAHAMLNWRPLIDVDDGLNQCRLWLEHHGYLSAARVSPESSQSPRP